MRQRELAKKFVNGKKSGQASNMFIRERGKVTVIHSYGAHFPIALKFGDNYIFNIDNRSRSTSQHQSTVRREIKHSKGEIVAEVDTDTFKEMICKGAENYEELMARMLKS